MCSLTTTPQIQEAPVIALITVIEVLATKSTEETRHLPMNPHLARVFRFRARQSKKLPKIAFATIWESAETSDARARERTLKYRERYEPIYDKLKVAYRNRGTLANSIS